MAGLEFEWDDAKNTANIVKHGVGFVLARDVFKDVSPSSVWMTARTTVRSATSLLVWSKAAYYPSPTP
jgi:uncharacterized DUF497 family protein